MKLEALKNGVELPEFAAKLPKVAVASAISGLIVAALILMTPNPWFEAFIVETGLPSLISAAEPPLGARARIVFALIAALIVTTVAWIALKVITDRKFGQPLRDPVSIYDLEDEPLVDAPIRRRTVDAHPDHPPRAPIMAGADLGTPLDLVDVAMEDEDDVGAVEEVSEAGDVAEAEEIAEVEEAAVDEDPWPGFGGDIEPPTFDTPESAPVEVADSPAYEESVMPDFAAEAPAEEPEEVSPVDAPVDASVAGEAVAEIEDEPIFTIPLRGRPSEHVDEKPVEEPQETVSANQDNEPIAAEVQTEAPLASTVAEPTAAQPPAIESDAELSDLIARLEAGLDRRRARFQKLQQASAAGAVDQTADSALREALDALHKVTAKRA
ncbi:MAG: hypothetical protein HKN78_04120 [Sphingomonadaceae bacterium]|nr:hypothetical protein [Sphingomonadaceae bacterium]